MEETEKKDVISQDVVEPEKTESSPPLVEENKPKESDVGSKDYNWRRMEEKLRELENRNLELEKTLKNGSEKKPPQEDELSQLQADDLITYGQLDKLAEKKARAIFQEEMQKTERAKQPQVVKSKYPDFEQVVTTENIEKLIKEDPELEKLIMLSENPFERTYKEIKRSEFYKSKIVTSESDEKIAENQKKPVSSNTLGKQRPLSYANSYAKGNPELWDEMQKYRGGLL